MHEECIPNYTSPVVSTLKNPADPALMMILPYDDPALNFATV